MFQNTMNTIMENISFTKEIRFENFDHVEMTKNLNDILLKKNSKLETLVGYFPKLMIKI